MNYGGAVAACGLAASFKLDTTVMPFILRNVSLRGVDSVYCPLERRTRAWQRLARALEVPVVSLFGFTNPKRSGPYRRYGDLSVDGYARWAGDR